MSDLTVQPPNGKALFRCRKGLPVALFFTFPSRLGAGIALAATCNEDRQVQSAPPIKLGVARIEGSDPQGGHLAVREIGGARIECWRD